MRFRFRTGFVIVSTIGTVVGGTVLLKDYIVGSDLKLDRNVKADGKIAIVTGSNTGIGKETVRELARRGAEVYMACRDLDKCEKAREEIVLETKNPLVHCQKCDLADFDSIRKFVKDFKEKENRLDILINNAGVMRIPVKQLTKQGIEMQLGVNHMGHFLLTNLLLDLLKDSAPSRIVVLSSVSHYHGTIEFEDLNMNRYISSDAYNQSKLANILFTKELARRLEGTHVTVNAVYPGISKTQLGRHMSWNFSFFGKHIAAPIMNFILKSPKQGSFMSIYVALEPSLAGTTGKYFSNMKEEAVSTEANDMHIAAKLWATSEKWTKLQP